MSMRPQQLKQRGFTLVELMIASVIFAIVLLVITQGLILIGRTYYRGTINNRTQETARSIVDDIAQSIQFSGGTIIAPLPKASPAVSGFCVGQVRYSFALRQQYTGGTNRKFVRDSVPCVVGRNALSVSEMNETVVASRKGDELLGVNMRVVKLSVTQNPTAEGDLYDISLRLAYGGGESLCSPAVSGDCDRTDDSGTSATAGDLVCKNNRTLQQFCSVVEINTTVNKRLK